MFRKVHVSVQVKLATKLVRANVEVFQLVELSQLRRDRACKNSTHGATVGFMTHRYGWVVLEVKLRGQRIAGGTRYMLRVKPIHSSDLIHRVGKTVVNHCKVMHPGINDCSCTFSDDPLDVSTRRTPSEKNIIGFSKEYGHQQQLSLLS